MGDSKRRPLPSPQPLSALAARFTDGHTGGPAERDVGARWDRLRIALGKPTARPGRRRVGLFLGMSGGALALATALLIWLRWQGPPVTYVLAGAALGGDGYIAGVAAAPAALTFSEGTKVDLAPGSRAVVVATDRHGARVRLEDGGAHFSVVHRPRARWAVDAGPFTVQVIGTTFDVRWSGSDDLFEIHLLVGSVHVHGPLTGDGVTLQAGEKLQARVNQGMLRVERVGAPSAAISLPAARTPTALAPPKPFTPPSAFLVPSVRTAAPPPRAPHSRAVAVASPSPTLAIGQSWRQRVASGDFRSVVAEAEEQGLVICLKMLPDDRLGTLADAARYSGRADIASDALSALRERFPGSPAARRAAFLLGRLAEESGQSPSLGLRWYEMYLTEAPNGSYASEALGRQMLVVNRQSGAAAASALARQYLRLFPSGAYAAEAESVVAGAP
ncbi:MAG TPA: FecR domain-containing protein [Polyangia bacterium]|nr:FecR domain-containing protein [Polyangia bacterium]